MHPSSDQETSVTPRLQPESDAADLPGWQDRPVERYRDGAPGGAPNPASGAVAQECPVALVFNGISHAVMMCTPRDLEAFGMGFALTEGIVARGSDVQEIEVELFQARAASAAAGALGAHAEIRLTIVQQAFAGLKEKRRSLAGRTGCGVCGIESIDLLDLDPERVPDTGFFERLAPDAVSRAAQAMPAHQALMQATGGVHAAAWCTADGAISLVCEDVGRHNALDKLLGALTMQRADLTNGFVLLSSRASYELVRKAARLGVPMLATISAPTTLAISIAQQAGIRLVCFCRGDTFVEYVAPPR
jgi:FdhD protein